VLVLLWGYSRSASLPPGRAEGERRRRLSLKYTLCFCRCSGRLLVLLRRKPPHAGQWNGVGGKIEPCETPRACVVREVREETGIDLTDATDLRFGGIVTWPPDEAVNGQGSGMYVYIAEICDPTMMWPGDQLVPDGTLRWQQQAWVCDRTNRLVVENIPAFLEPMLRGEPPREYYCDFQGERLLSVQARRLLPAGDETLLANGEPRAEAAP
jgi:8-oxo-dGTP diphosphatase